MANRDFWSRLIEIHERSARGEPVPGWSIPLFALGLVGDRLPRELKRWVYESGLLPRKRLPATVVSIGNLSTGGSGKTPLVEWLTRWVMERGRPAAVLTRGYKRRGDGASSWAALVSRGNGSRLGPESAGDEAWALAAALPGATVIAGKVRASTGALAARLADCPVLILDDGFQYVRLARDLDVVALDATLERPALRPFPVGRLREPLESLSRADLVVITRTESAGETAIAALRERIGAVAPAARVAVARMRPESLVEVVPSANSPVAPAAADPEAVRPLARLAGQRVVAMAGIGRPEHFFETIERLGARAAVRAFPDHHLYTYEDVAAVAALARREGARGVVTTAKDLANLPAGADFGCPLQVLTIGLELSGVGFDLDAWLAARLTSSCRPAPRPPRNGNNAAPPSAGR